MSDQDGLQWALRLDGQGGAVEIGWEGIRAPLDPRTHVWVHVDRTAPAVTSWLEEYAQLPPGITSALLAEETRPRVLRVGDGLLVVVRAVNLNPGATPDDMISLRLWIDQRRTISLRQRKLRATFEVADALCAREGPTSPGELVEHLVARIVDGIEESLEDLVERVDDLEGSVAKGGAVRPRRVLAELRGEIVTMHKHLTPQRQALGKLSQESTPLINEAQRTAFRELAERSTRLVEELDALRERGNVISDELVHQMAEALSRRMYFFSMAATVFMPLSLLAGLMGANVGGIPGAANSSGFWVLTAVVALAAALGIAVISTIGWLRTPADEEVEEVEAVEEETPSCPG